jgi:hypothetical protein
MMLEFQNVQWHKSSYSGMQNDCVEVGHGLHSAVPVRDSKNPTGGFLAFSPESWMNFIDGVKSGAFDH